MHQKLTHIGSRKHCSVISQLRDLTFYYCIVEKSKDNENLHMLLSDDRIIDGLMDWRFAHDNIYIYIYNEFGAL